MDKQECCNFSIFNSVFDLSEQNPTKDLEKAASVSSNENAKQPEDVYSEDYFSSGSEDEHLVGGQGSKSKERRKMLTNDDLLYDPDMDDEDEKWVIKQRQEHRMKGVYTLFFCFFFCTGIIYLIRILRLKFPNLRI